MTRHRLFGLTGGIATGKSTAARFLREAGAEVIDADELARGVVEPGRPALEEIRIAFGPEVIRADGSLDRVALGARVFRDPEARTRLNAIVHPRVEEAARAELASIVERNPEALVFYDVPLLYEARLEGRFEAVVVVYVSRSEQLRRLIARDGLSEDEALRRIRSQLDIEEKARRADFVVDNAGSLEDLRHGIERLLHRIHTDGRADKKN